MPPTAEYRGNLPSPSPALLDTLQSIRRKVRLYGVAFGAGVVVAAAVVLLLATVLIDFLFWTAGVRLPAAPRLVLILAVFAAVGFAAWRYLLSPMLAKLTISDLAGRLENAFPQFDDRLRSTVDFARGDYVPGSEPMKRQTVADAERLSRDVDLSRAVVTKPVWYSVGAGAAALLLVGLLLAIVSDEYRNPALSRLNPFSNREWPKNVEISLIKGLPARVPVGQRVEVQMRLAKGDRANRKAVIYYRYDDGSWQQELMTRNEQGIYTASLDTRIDAGKPTGKLQVRVESGDDEYKVDPVTIVPRLEIVDVAAAVELPAYAGSESYTVNLTERPAVMPGGSKVGLNIRFNKGLDPNAEIQIRPSSPQAKVPPMVWQRGTSNTRIGRFAAGTSFRFSVLAKDEDGFENTGTQEYELIVREDGMPMVQIEEPRRSEERTAVASFPLKAVAEDDYGVAQAQLVVTRVGEKTQPPAAAAAPAAEGAAQGPAAPAAPAPGAQWVIDLVKDGVAAGEASWQPVEGNGERRRYRTELLWDLAKLEGANLKSGDVLEYFVRVKDNYLLPEASPPEHEWVSSGKLRITIISEEQAQNAARDVAQRIAQELKAIKQSQTSSKMQTGELAKQAQEKGKFDEADQTTAQRLADQQATTASTTKQAAQKLNDLAERMKENKLPEQAFRETVENVSKDLERGSEAEMKEAAKAINEAKDQKANPQANAEQQKQDAQQRAGKLNEANQNQERAEATLQRAVDKLGDFNSLTAMREKIEAIKKAQDDLGREFNKHAKDQLGKKPEDMTAEAKKKAEDLGAKQADLQKRTQQALEQMKKASDQSQKSDPSKSEAMKQAAQAGEQVPGQQQKNQQAMQQNQQAQAQQAQKQVELGLEMILQKLREAEQRELMELAKKLNELQQLIEELLARQANHNLDNLTLDADGAKLTKMSDADKTELMTLAGRDPAALPPPPALEDLPIEQERTEANTRDVAKKAESLEDPTATTRLTGAAGHMGRAIGHLRKAKLPDAYDPPQVEALKALKEAWAVVDKARQEAEKKLDEQQQEKIREAYVKLLDDHKKKVSVPTTEINNTPKDAAGALPREKAVLLGQLPGEEGALADRAGKIGDQLTQLRSVVYLWANKRIVDGMKDVQEELAKPDTGVVTQTKQKVIEDQLQKMIDNLAQKPPLPPRFEQRAGGGGGGQGEQPPRVPTEAELRLLKEFQQIVNHHTKEIDGLAEKDKQRLLETGGLQGEVRSTLDELLKQSSEGKVTLGPEPDNKDQLPEEASAEAVDNQEIDADLLGDDPKKDAVEKSIKLTGDRMARSRQRLAMNNDPGKTTQIIQDRIVMDLDDLIKLAQQQQQQSQCKPGKGKPGQKPGPPKPGEGQQQAKQQGKPGESKNPGGRGAAQRGGLTPGDENAADLTRELQEDLAEWGSLTPRERQAVREGQSEQLIEKYRQLIQDYYRSLGEKSGQQR